MGRLHLNLVVVLAVAAVALADSVSYTRFVKLSTAVTDLDIETACGYIVSSLQGQLTCSRIDCNRFFIPAGSTDRSTGWNLMLVARLENENYLPDWLNMATPIWAQYMTPLANLSLAATPLEFAVTGQCTSPPLDPTQLICQADVNRTTTMHAVLLKINNTLPDTEITSMCASLCGLYGIPGVLRVTCGAASSWAQTHFALYDFRAILLVTLTTAPALASYAINPIHVTLRDTYIAPRLNATAPGKSTAIDITGPPPPPASCSPLPAAALHVAVPVMLLAFMLVAGMVMLV